MPRDQKVEPALVLLLVPVVEHAHHVEAYRDPILDGPQGTRSPNQPSQRAVEDGLTIWVVGATGEQVAPTT